MTPAEEAMRKLILALQKERKDKGLDICYEDILNKLLDEKLLTLVEILLNEEEN